MLPESSLASNEIAPFGSGGQVLTIWCLHVALGGISMFVSGVLEFWTLFGHVVFWSWIHLNCLGVTYSLPLYYWLFLCLCRTLSYMLHLQSECQCSSNVCLHNWPFKPAPFSSSSTGPAQPPHTHHVLHHVTQTWTLTAAIRNWHPLCKTPTLRLWFRQDQWHH